MAEGLYMESLESCADLVSSWFLSLNSRSSSTSCSLCFLPFLSCLIRYKARPREKDWTGGGGEFMSSTQE